MNGTETGAAGYLHLVRKTRERLYPKCSQIDAEDLEGAGRLALFAAYARYDPAKGVRVETYLIACVRGAMRSAAQQLWQYTEELPELEGTAPCPVERAEESELWDLVATLPQPHRSVVYLYFRAGYTIEEVAAEIGKSPARTAVLLRCSLRALREALSGNPIGWALRQAAYEAEEPRRQRTAATSSVPSCRTSRS